MVYHLIDPQTGPYSNPDDIRAEMAEIEELSRTPERDRVLDMMCEWLGEPKPREWGPGAPVEEALLESEHFLSKEDIGNIFEFYEKKFGRLPPLPFGIHEHEVAIVLEFCITNGQPLAEDYDWYQDLPPDAFANHRN